jgi:hypothetical protein
MELLLHGGTPVIQKIHRTLEGPLIHTRAIPNTDSNAILQLHSCLVIDNPISAIRLTQDEARKTRHNLANPVPAPTPPYSAAKPLLAPFSAKLTYPAFLAGKYLGKGWRAKNATVLGLV